MPGVQDGEEQQVDEHDADPDEARPEARLEGLAVLLDSARKRRFRLRDRRPGPPLPGRGRCRTPRLALSCDRGGRRDRKAETSRGWRGGCSVRVAARKVGQGRSGTGYRVRDGGSNSRRRSERSVDSSVSTFRAWGPGCDLLTGPHSMGLQPGEKGLPGNGKRAVSGTFDLSKLCLPLRRRASVARARTPRKKLLHRDERAGCAPPCARPGRSPSRDEEKIPCASARADRFLLDPADRADRAVGA